MQQTMISGDVDVERARVLSEPVATGPMLVATDGSAGADSAFVAARLLTAHTGADTHVMAVLESITVTDPYLGVVPLSPELTRARRDALEARALEQRARLAGAATDWPVTIVEGDPAREIARVARAQNARLVLMGRGQHMVLDRLVGGETVLRVLRLATVPVLAASPDLMGLPRRIVVGIDFSAYSLRAARAALALAAPDAVVYLVHVVPRLELLAAGLESWDANYERALPLAFARVAERLAAVSDAQLEPVTLRGNAGNALIEFGAASRADLVVAGSHGYGFINRLILGSVATKLVRGATCSVLCVPGVGVEPEVEEDGMNAQDTTTVDEREWARALADFTSRNAGRTCTVEVDQTPLGAQVLGTALPLVGASFDHRTHAITLDFGASRLAGEHLSHTVPAPRQLHVLADAGGRDRALRIAHEGGQTLVMLTG